MMFNKNLLGVLLLVSVSSAFAQDGLSTKKLTGDRLWYNRLLYANENRCLKEEIPILATRHGFDAWLYGSNPQPNMQEAISRIRQKDQDQVRVSELVFDEALLTQAATIALQGVELPKDIKLSVATLNCHAPKMRLGTPEDQKIYLSFQCDTSYMSPWKSNCKVSDKDPCTTIEVSLKPYYKPIDEVSARLGAKVDIEKMYFAFPSIEQYIDGKTSVLSQQFESYTQELKKSLEQATNIQNESLVALAKIQTKYGTTHELVAQFKESAKMVSEYLSMMTGLGSDKAEFSQLSQLLLGISSKDAASFESGLSVVAPAIQAVLRGIGSLEDQMLDAHYKIEKILNDLDSSESNVEASLTDLHNSVTTLKDSIAQLDQSVKDCKLAFQKIKELGAKQDESAKVLWQELVTNLKREFDKLPREFPLVTVKPMTRTISDMPVFGGPIQISAHIGIPRIELTTSFGGHKSLVVPIKMNPLHKKDAKGSLQ